MTAPEIEVTPEMVDAGLQELGEHRFTTDLREVLEEVYRAMAYADLARASSTSGCGFSSTNFAPCRLKDWAQETNMPMPSDEMNSTWEMSTGTT